MKFITIPEAIKKYNKSRSTIRKAIYSAEKSDTKKGKKLNSGLYTVLISEGFLNGYFNHSETTEKTTKTSEKELIETLKNQVKDQQKTIDKLFEHQSASDSTIKKLTENEERFQILINRADLRNDLLEKHFNASRKQEPTKEQKKLALQIEEAEIVKEETTFNIDDIPNDAAEFSVWIQRLNESKNK
jgi:septal ring factor EnvC (AmiA/AmiB activator)